MSSICFAEDDYEYKFNPFTHTRDWVRSDTSFDDTYLKKSGSNADETIDIGSQDLTTTGTLTAEHLYSTDDAVITDILTVPTIYGSTASSGDLTLSSTSHATKGIINLGDTAYVDEVNNRLGIGTDEPRDWLDVIGSIFLGSTIDGTAKAGKITMSQYNSDSEPEGFTLFQGFTFSASNDVYFGGGTSNANAATHLRFYTAANSTTRTGSIRMQIHDTGGIAIGDSYYATDPGTNNVIIEGNVGIGSTDPEEQFEIAKTGGNSVGPMMTLRQLSEGIAVATDNILGEIKFAGNDRFAGEDGVGAKIVGYAETGWSGTTNTYPAFLAFYTNPVGVNPLAERMRITSAGNVGIGSTTPWETLTVVGDFVVSGPTPRMGIRDDGTNNLHFLHGGDVGTETSFGIVEFYTKGVDDGSGTVTVGTAPFNAPTWYVDNTNNDFYVTQDLRVGKDAVVDGTMIGDVSLGFTAGSIPYSNGTILVEDNDKLLYDTGNTRLTIKDDMRIYNIAGDRYMFFSHYGSGVGFGSSTGAFELNPGSGLGLVYKGGTNASWRVYGSAGREYYQATYSAGAEAATLSVSTGYMNINGGDKLVLKGTVIGLNESFPETLLEMSGTAPYFTFHNTTEENIDGGRESKILFKGEQDGTEETTLGSMVVSHDGTGDDEKGKWELNLNATADGDAPSNVITAYSNGEVLFQSKVLFTQVDGNEYIDSLADGYMDYGATTGHRFLTSNVTIAADLLVDGNTIGNTLDPDMIELSASTAVIVSVPVRSSTSSYRRYYHSPISSQNPGASGATWVKPGTASGTEESVGGWRQTSLNHDLVMPEVDIHADWDGATDMILEAYFECGVDNTLGLLGDTIDFTLYLYYKSVGDDDVKTQTLTDSITVDQSTIYKMFKAEFTIDWDLLSHEVEVGDVMKGILELNTVASEVDNAVINHMTFYYQTTHIGIEASDV